jgi:hypothetical protein
VVAVGVGEDDETDALPQPERARRPKRQEKTNLAPRRHD